MLNSAISSITGGTFSTISPECSTSSTSGSDDDVPPLMPADDPFYTWIEDCDTSERVWGPLAVNQGEWESEEAKESLDVPER
jgi:hypothetical protein